MIKGQVFISGAEVWTDCHIETIIDQLKNIAQIEHSRHGSVANFFANLLGGLIAYCQST